MDGSWSVYARCFATSDLLSGSADYAAGDAALRTWTARRVRVSGEFASPASGRVVRARRNRAYTMRSPRIAHSCRFALQGYGSVLPLCAACASSAPPRMRAGFDA